MNPRRWGWVFAPPALFVAAVGFGHTKSGHFLLRAMHIGAGCPVSLSAVDPEKMQAYQTEAMQKMRGDVATRSRGALGFELGKTTRGEVLASVAAQGGRCVTEPSGSTLRCSGIGEPTPRSTPRIDDLYVRFAPDGRLMALDAMHAPATPSEGERTLLALSEGVIQRAGQPSYVDAAAPLAAHPYSQRRVEFRFRDEAIDLSAMNHPDRGAVIREQYRFIPD